MPKRKKIRQHLWQQRQTDNAKCWKCKEDAHPKLSPTGKVIGYYKMCAKHLEMDRNRTALKRNYKRKYNVRSEKIAA